MRILKVTQAYFPFQSRGGPALKVRSIARELVKQGHQVTVLTAALGFGPAEVEMASAARNRHGWVSHQDGVQTVYFPTLFSYRNLTVNSGFAGYCRQCVRDFDIAHIYGLYDLLGPVVAKYCRKNGVPYFVEPLGMTRPIDRAFALKKAWWKLLGGYFSRASRIIVTSEMEKAEVIGAVSAAERVLLRYNGIDGEGLGALPAPGTFRAKVGVSGGERLILFLGRLIPRKGADLLVQALPQLAGSNVRLVIAGPEGEPGYLESLRTLAREMGVDKQVLFSGPLYGEDKRAAMVDATIFALPSRYENFGNVAAEAIACGTPSLVTDHCGIAPLIDQRAGLVTTYDATAVAGALKTLLENATLYRRLKLGCAVVADELSWEHLVPRIVQTYQEAIAQAKAAG